MSRLQTESAFEVLAKVRAPEAKFESPLPHQTNSVGLVAPGRPQVLHSSLWLE
jgi:hypothetical protein